MLAQLSDVHLSFPDKKILDGISFAIHRGEKVGLVGENGAGKTTLFRLLLGELSPDQGDVARATGLRVGYLQQTLIDTHQDHADRVCIEAALATFSHLTALEHEIDALANRLAGPDHDTDTESVLQLLGDKQQEFEQSGGYTFRTRVETTLQGVGLPERLWHLPVRDLSAGQKVRLAISVLILGEYDLLLLDEPTNHLDVEGGIWLEATLREMPIAALVVSHDRRFLDHVVDKVAHLDRGRLHVYRGNYSAFRAQQDMQLSTDWQTYEKRRRQIRKLETQARNYHNWSHAKEGEKRGTLDKGYVGHKAAKLMKRSLVAKRRLEQTIEEMRLEKPFEKDPIAIDFHAAEGARRLISVRNLVIGFDPEQPLAAGISFDMKAGDRLAVQGANGTGKTTLLRTVLGHLSPLDGEITLSQNAGTGYFDQENSRMPPDATALEATLAAHQDETMVRTVMGRMGIRRESVQKRLAQLSLGERAKVLLTCLILGNHNLLVLDEPTNYLDIETQDTLLDALTDFPGGILFVSHDRHFVESLATCVLDV